MDIWVAKRQCSCSLKFNLLANIMIIKGHARRKWTWNKVPLCCYKMVTKPANELPRDLLHLSTVLIWCLTPTMLGISMIQHSNTSQSGLLCSLVIGSLDSIGDLDDQGGCFGTTRGENDKKQPEEGWLHHFQFYISLSKTKTIQYHQKQEQC